MGQARCFNHLAFPLFQTLPRACDKVCDVASKIMQSASLALPTRLLACCVVAALALWQLIYFAWIGDDAAITLRTVLNFAWGYGPVFNIGERVQGYTHPLWFLLLSLSYLLVGNLLLSAFLLSFVVSLLVALVLTQVVASTAWAGFCALGILLTAKSYIDYTASGLENPISHLTLLCATLLALRACRTRTTVSYTYFILSCSFAWLSRADLALIVAPLIVYVTFAVRLPMAGLLKAMLIGALPALAWETFSFLYYGLPFPNTAYAKLSTGVPLADSVRQGLYYFEDSLLTDPVTLATIACGIMVGIISSSFDRALAVGVILYLAYILRIGGDFMSGRFFTVPLIVALAILVRRRFGSAWIAAALLICGAIYIPTSVLKNEKQRLLREHGIADERLIYFPENAFRTQFPSFEAFDKDYRDIPPGSRPNRVAKQCGGLGFSSLKFGPRFFFIDECALTDPLLARLPALPNSRIGHWMRAVPANYQFSVYADRNALVDEDLRRYYDDIRSLTRGPVLSLSRIGAIIRLLVEPTPDFSAWGEPSANQARSTDTAYEVIDVSRLAVEPQGGARWDAQGNIVMYGHGIEVVFSSPERLSMIDTSLDGNDLYRFEYFDGSSFKDLFNLGPASAPEMSQYLVKPPGMGLVHYRRAVPPEIPATTRLRITPSGGDSSFSIGHLTTR